jgi:hypothetical protein
VAADDWSSPVRGIAPAPGSIGGNAVTQSATFEIAGLTLVLSAAAGAARLVVSGNGARDTYVVDPGALSQWAVATKKLLALTPIPTSADRIEFRAPFLSDREGRPSIAFEGLVSEESVTYRLLVTGAQDRVAGLMTSLEILRGVVEAASGAALVARRAT